MLDWTATWCELEPPPWLALLPLGSVEQHGPWLPLGTDWYQAGVVSEALAKELDAWLLPAQPYSCAQEHQEFPGTVNLRPATLAALLSDLADAVARSQVRRLAIINYHGGNWALKSIVRDINRRQDELVVYQFSPYEYVSGLAHDDLHSGYYETSQMLYLRPDLVRPGRQDWVPDIAPALLDQVGVRAVSPLGIWGRAAQANAEQGAADFAEMIANTVAIIRQTIARVDALKAPPSPDAVHYGKERP